RNVWHRVRHVEQKGIRLLPLNETNRMLRVPRGELRLVRRCYAVNCNFAVLPELQWKLPPILGILGMVFPHVVRVHQAARLIEASRGRAGIGLVSDMPFAVDSGPVAARLEDLTERR